MKTQPLTLLLALALLPSPAPAQWGSTPDDPLPICTAEGNQHSHRSIRLGSGRYLITWGDQRAGSTRAYYQLVDAVGVPLLQEDGVKLLPGINAYNCVSYLLPDGEGGAVAPIIDARNGAEDIYGQRFDSLGNRLWGETGLPLIEWPGTEDVSFRDAEVDDQGNIFLNWLRYIDPSGELYVQKVTNQGELPWGPYGMLDYNGGSFQDWQDLVPDYSGGAIDVWQMDQESDLLMTQHLDRTGNYYWPINGIPLMAPQGFQINFVILQILADGEGGGICVGTKYNYGMNYARIFRLIGQTGAVLWYKSWGSENSTFVDALSHPADGTIYALRVISPSPNQIRLHRFYPNGFQPFGPDGLAIENGLTLTATSDGVIVLGRNAQNTAILAQRYDSSGQALWPPVAYPLVYIEPSPGDWVACSDGENGAVAVWLDRRTYAQTNWDLYAARIRSDGSLGNVMPPYPYAPIYTQRQISIKNGMAYFTISQATTVRLELYDILGRQIAKLAEEYRQPGAYQIPLPIEDLPSGIYLLKFKTEYEAQTIKLTHRK